MGIDIKLGARQLPLYWVFLIFALICFAVAIFALRQNNEQMIELRAAVYQADEKAGDVEKAVNELREFVHSHMNTNLASGGNAIKPPIQLKYTYERLVATEQERVDKANSRIYTQAQEYCQAQNPSGFSGRGRVPCVTDYVTSRGEQVQEIPAALYKFDFVSPRWSPDLAGWSLICGIFSIFIFLVILIIDRSVRSKIKKSEF